MLRFTGERFTPECKGAIAYEHLHRYYLARSLVEGLDVADIACGEGYGAALMAETARGVLGMDIDVPTIHHAVNKYAEIPHCSFMAAKAHATGIDAGTFGAVVSFETIEHVEDQEATIAEFKRILKPGGFLLISTPNPSIYSPDGKHNGWHTKELTGIEFYDLLHYHFKHTLSFYQNFANVSLISSAGYMGNPTARIFMPEPRVGKYLITLASDREPDQSLLSAYYDPREES